MTNLEKFRIQNIFNTFEDAVNWLFETFENKLREQEIYDNITFEELFEIKEEFFDEIYSVILGDEDENENKINLPYNFKDIIVKNGNGDDKDD